jgi:hypothetical protein
VVRPKRTRPSTQYAANDLASPGYRNWLAPIRRLHFCPGFARSDVSSLTNDAKNHARTAAAVIMLDENLIRDNGPT